VATRADEQRPVFLSIGYSACHWCHVMAHESFEDDEIARLLNDQFISIKVDREERPDLDQLYMEAVQAISGNGGWPMSVFLTPEQEPFFGGTYWPLADRQGMPGFGRVLSAVLEAWQHRRDEVQTQAGRLTQALRDSRLTADDAEAITLEASPLTTAEETLERSFDAEHGGFGESPKFPQPTALRLLLARWQATGNERLRTVVDRTLHGMALGGIYDHLGGGFHRYSVDRQWLVPHFEKMLYDNAQLASCYVEAWQATGEPMYRRVARETCEYVLREMTLPDGGFASTQDADTEGEEGLFYVWTPDEVREALGPDRADAFCRAYDVTDAGNFEGRSILHLDEPLDGFHQERQELLAARNGRTPPGRDDKVLLGWNALMIDALARAGAAFDEPAFATAAARAAEFCLHHLADQQGQLHHCWRDGHRRAPAMLDDQAALASALLTLHETSHADTSPLTSAGQAPPLNGDDSNPIAADNSPGTDWLARAVRLADDLIDRFADREHGGFFTTPHDAEQLVVRMKDAVDTSTPSGNGLTAMLLLRLGEAAGRDDFTERGEHTLRAFWPVLQRIPAAAGQMLLALERQQSVPAR